MRNIEIYHIIENFSSFYTDITCIYITSNQSYVRLLNKTKVNVNNDRIYYNVNISADICDDLQLEGGSKMLIKKLNIDSIVIKRIDL